MMFLNRSRSKTTLFIILIFSLASATFIQANKAFANDIWQPIAFPSAHDGAVISVSAAVKKADFTAPTFFNIHLYAAHENSIEAQKYAEGQFENDSFLGKPANFVNQLTGKTKNGYWTAGIYSLNLDGKNLFIAVVTIEQSWGSAFTLTKVYNTQAEAEAEAEKLAIQWLGGVIDPCHHYPESCGELLSP